MGSLQSLITVLREGVAFTGKLWPKQERLTSTVPIYCGAELYQVYNLYFVALGGKNPRGKHGATHGIFNM